MADIKSSEKQKNITDKIDVRDAMAITPDFWGPLLSYVDDPEITDIDYNGTDTWIRTCHGARYKEESLKDKMTETFVNRLTNRIQTHVSKEFNPQNPLLEAETKVLRISIVHESVCNGRRSICIRKTPTSVRINTRNSVETGYASPELLSFLRNAVQAHFNLTICGEPGVGKTEFAKYVSMQIPKEERVITIEDSLEWHYHELKPDADCVEMQISPQFDYFMAIKACLRQNPNWIMVSEVRGKEVANYLQQLTTGVHGITTIHTGDVGDVPDRLCNMAADTSSREKTENDIYTFLDLAVLVDMVTNEEGLRKRRVAQVGLFMNIDGEHKLLRIFDNGQLVMPNLPDSILARFARAHIDNPFINDDVISDCKGLDLSSLKLVRHISTQDTNTQNKPDIINNDINDNTDDFAKQAMERRANKRFDVNISVPIKLGDNTFDTIITKNVSRSGIGFVSKRVINTDSIGNTLWAAFPYITPDGQDKPIYIEMNIVRSIKSPEGMYYGCQISKVSEGWNDYIDSFNVEV